MKLIYAIPALLFAFYNNKSAKAAEADEEPDNSQNVTRTAEHDPDAMQSRLKTLERKILSMQLREIGDAAKRIVIKPLVGGDKGLDFVSSSYGGAEDKMYQLMVDPKIMAKGAVVLIFNNSHADDKYKEAIELIRKGDRNRANQLISESEKYILATQEFLDKIDLTEDEELNMKHEDLEEAKAIYDLRAGEEKNNRMKALGLRIAERIKNNGDFRRYATQINLYAQAEEEPETVIERKQPTRNNEGIESVVLDSFDDANESNANWDIVGDGIAFNDDGKWSVGVWGNPVMERSITSRTDLKQEGAYMIVVEWSITNYEKGIFSIEMTDGRNTRLLKRGPGTGGPYLLRVDINEHKLATTFVDGKREGVVDLSNLNKWYIRFNTKAGEEHFVVYVDEVSYRCKKVE